MRCFAPSFLFACLLTIVTPELSSAQVGAQVDSYIEASEASSLSLESPIIDAVRESHLPEMLFDPDDPSDWEIIKSIPSDAFAALKAPVGWTQEEWAIAAATVAASALLMTGDMRISQVFREHHSPQTHEISSFLENFTGSPLPLAMGATYIVGLILRDKDLKRAAVLSASVYLVSGAVTHVLKTLAGRRRPHAADSAWDFNFFHIDTGDRRSFPSGHTAIGFAVAHVFSSIYHENKLVKFLAFSAAVLSAVSRVHDQAHFASDILAGAVIGVGVAELVMNRRMGEQEGVAGRAVETHPIVKVSPWGTLDLGFEIR